MELLIKAASFGPPVEDLKDIYNLFIRSILEQSAVVWHSSLTKKNRRDLERVQKSAVIVIMGEKFQNYKHGLKTLKLETLEKRRERLCLSFAKKCLNNEKVSNFFPKNVPKHKMRKRKQQKVYKTKRINTERYKKSSIPYMVNLLNHEQDEKNQYLQEINI